MEITLESSYGFVFLAVVLGQFINIYLASNVMKARKKHGIEYPNLYADRTLDGEDVANAFNLVQRAH